MATRTTQQVLITQGCNVFNNDITAKTSTTIVPKQSQRATDHMYYIINKTLIVMKQSKHDYKEVATTGEHVRTLKRRRRIALWW